MRILCQFWDSFIAIVGGLMLAFTVLSPVQNYGFINSDEVRILGTLLFVVFGIVTIYRAQSSLYRYKNTLPNIVAMGKPKWEDKMLGDVWRRAYGIEFKNVPKHPSDKSAALKVSATVRWINMDGKFIRENHGRWFITNRERDVGKVELQTIDIYPNDSSAKLYFAITSTDNKHLYTWSRIKDEPEEGFELDMNCHYHVEIILFDSLGLRWEFRESVNVEGMNLGTETNE